jgi:hypothetical protein
MIFVLDAQILGRVDNTRMDSRRVNAQHSLARNWHVIENAHLFLGGTLQLLLRQPGRTGVQMNSAGGSSCSIGKVRSFAQRSIPENNANETTGRPGLKAAAKATQRSNAGAAGICFLYL